MTRTDARRKAIPRSAATAATAAALAVAIFASAAPAAAQMLDRPFSFTTRDRAGLAALIRNVENSSDRSNSGGQARAAAPSSTVNVCFSGASESEAAGNKECIILNEADGAISTEQSSNGDQSADNEQSVENNTELSDAIEDLAD